MKEIGIVEKYYHIIQTSPKKFMVEFQVGEHRVSIENFKFYEEMSEETNAFSGELIIDGINVGRCTNDGKGGCASYYAHNNWDLARTIEEETAQLQNYTFPTLRMNLYDVIDTIASIMISFKSYKVLSLARAKNVISILNKYADDLHNKYSSEKTNKEPVSLPCNEEKKEEPVSVQFHGRTWQKIDKTDTRVLNSTFVCNHIDGCMYMDESSRQFFFLKHEGEQFVSNF